MPKLYLHVGLPKTATTSIQRFLLDNRDALIKAGILYPNAGLQRLAHHPLGQLFNRRNLDWVKNVDGGELYQSLREEMEATGCDTVIMSTESLVGTPKLEELKEYFADFDTEIVLYLRRQDEWLESAYKDNLKTGASNLAPAAYIEHRMAMFDFERLVGRWAEVFGREHIHLGTFEMTKEQQSVGQSMLEMLGIEFEPVHESNEASNTSLNRDCLAFLSAMPTKRRIGYRNWIYANILREYSAKNPDPPEWKRVWPAAERRALIERFADSNARVAREYCGREDGVLFRGALPSDDEPWEEYPGLTATKAVEIAEFLADSLFDRAEADRQKRQPKNRR